MPKVCTVHTYISSFIDKLEKIWLVDFTAKRLEHVLRSVQICLLVFLLMHICIYEDS